MIGKKQNQRGLVTPRHLDKQQEGGFIPPSKPLSEQEIYELQLKSTETGGDNSQIVDSMVTSRKNIKKQIKHYPYGGIRSTPLTDDVVEELQTQEAYEEQDGFLDFQES